MQIKTLYDDLCYFLRYLSYMKIFVIFRDISTKLTDYVFLIHC